MTYNSGQVSVIYPFLKAEPEWLLLGGPADGDEAQCFHVAYPKAKILSCEPMQEFIRWQSERNFPGILLPYALGSYVGYGAMTIYGGGNARSARLVKGKDTFVTTLDHLDGIYGPFNRVVLWLDVEGSEYLALQGAKELFARKAIILVNVEMMIDKDRIDIESSKQVDRFLTDRNFHRIETWDVASGNHYDAIYVPKTWPF